jgi:drug/metabolite transporter (DMT)-like permease
MNAYILTLFANLSFSLGSQFFTHYSRKFSSTWMNTYKALVAAFCFGLVILITEGFRPIELRVFCWFLLSGFIGLGLGDILLLKAYEKIGPGRTMVLFGFHPIVIGLLAYIIFDQSLKLKSIWAIVFFIGTLAVFSLESFKKQGHWDLSGLVFAFGGMLLDASGVLITRFAFEQTTNLTAFEGNFYRCLGALFSYFIIHLFFPFQFKSRFYSLDKKSKFYVFLGAFLGTFLSLALYLQAIKMTDNLAGISAIAITGVIFSSAFECIWEKKRPSVYLVCAFIFFLIGMKFNLDY